MSTAIINSAPRSILERQSSGSRAAASQSACRTSLARKEADLRHACALAFFCFIAIVRGLSPGTNRRDASIAAPHPPPLGGSCAGARRREPRRLRPARACGAAARNAGARGDPAGGGGSESGARGASGRRPALLKPLSAAADSGHHRQSTPGAISLPARPAAVSRCIFSTIETARSTPRRSPWRRSPMRWARPSIAIPAATIRRHYRVFSQAFAGLDALVCYAVKANSNQAVSASPRTRGRGDGRGLRRRAGAGARRRRRA